MIERRENVIHVFCSVCADCGLRFSDLDSKENQKKKVIVYCTCASDMSETLFLMNIVGSHARTAIP